MPLDADTTRRIRLLIPDTDAIFGDTKDQYLFSDDDIADFYAIGNESIKWAAGLAKKTVGSSEALILKVITNYETKTDGAALMKQWEAAGQALIEEAKSEDEIGVLDYFEVIYDEEDVWPEGKTYGFAGWRV